MFLTNHVKKKNKMAASFKMAALKEKFGLDIDCPYLVYCIKICD